MIRMIITFIKSIFVYIYYLKIYAKKIYKDPDKYTPEQRYMVVQKITGAMQRNGKVTQIVTGEENLPKTGGYVLYPNHQGKYDVPAIVNTDANGVISVVIDKKRSYMMLNDDIIRLTEGKRLDKTDPKDQVKIILEIVKEVKAGKRYIIFSEGGYTDNHNHLQEFMAGTFKCSMKSKTPICPVALIDSYKVFGVNSLKPVTVQIHYLEPIYYEEYKDMSTHEVADLVKSRIQSKIDKVFAAEGRVD